MNVLHLLRQALLRIGRSGAQESLRPESEDDTSVFQLRPARLRAEREALNALREACEQARVDPDGAASRKP